jgi:hypothetical protein
MIDRDRDDRMVVGGKASTKVSVHDVRSGKDFGVVGEFADGDEFLAKHRQNLGKSEHILERKMGKAPRWVPVEEYKKELRARKKD